jgi:hypothetical protein
MEQYILKSALVAEIKKRLYKYEKEYERLAHYEIWITAKDIEPKIEELKNLLSFLDTLEIKEADTWHLQEKEDIYDAVKGWDIHTFACIMKDGTLQKFTGCRDEDYEGCITTHIDGVNDDYDDVDDIVKWIELT